jgi:hypothetical protein
MVVLLTRRPSEPALHLNVFSQCSCDKRFGIVSIVSLRDSDVSFVIALMLAVGVNSLVGGAFQYRPFFRLQLVPHLTKHHQVCALYSPFLTHNTHCVRPLVSYMFSLLQWWRLLTYQLAFSSSSDVFISNSEPQSLTLSCIDRMQVILYNVSVALERIFGSRKFGVSSLSL